VTRVWVFADVSAGGAVDPSTLALLTRARAIADEVAAVALGPGATAAGTVLGEYGATRVFADDRAVYAEHPGEPAAYVLARLAEKHAPDLVLFGASFASRDVAGRAQALLGAPLVANVSEVIDVRRIRLVVALLLTPGCPGNVRGGIGGDKLVDVELTGDGPALLLVRPQADAGERCGGRAEVVTFDEAIPDERRRVRLRERHETTAAGPRLEDARVVVAGGRGLGGADGFRLLDEVAASIGEAAVGATRPVVDAGWAPFARQIGQSGKTVRPDVYIAVGVSGAAQHMAGAGDARMIVAINSDPAAPIFQHADIAVVGDAATVLPALLAELERAKLTPYSS
jgi:electron transfer flavoprotein alpha subunit